LSHCQQDQSSHHIETLVNMLEESTRELVWLDSKNLSRATDLHKEMEVGVERATCIIILLSRLYLSQQNCLKELKLAFQQYKSKGKNIVLIAVDNGATFEAMQAWERETKVCVDNSEHGGIFVHQSTVSFVKDHLLEFCILDQWVCEFDTDEERDKARWDVIEEIIDNVRDNAEEENPVMRYKVSLQVKHDTDGWFLQYEGEEELQYESRERMRDRKGKRSHSPEASDDNLHRSMRVLMNGEIVGNSAAAGGSGGLKRGRLNNFAKVF